MPGHWSKYEHPFHVSPTPSQHDAIDAIELALAAYQEMFGHPLADLSPIDEATGEIKTVKRPGFSAALIRAAARG